MIVRIVCAYDILWMMKDRQFKPPIQNKEYPALKRRVTSYAQLFYNPTFSKELHFQKMSHHGVENKANYLIKQPERWKRSHFTLAANCLQQPFNKKQQSKLLSNQFPKLLQTNLTEGVFQFLISSYPFQLWPKISSVHSFKMSWCF